MKKKKTLAEISRETGTPYTTLQYHAKRIGRIKAVELAMAGKLKPKRSAKHKYEGGYLFLKVNATEIKNGDSLTMKEWSDLLGLNSSNFASSVARSGNLAVAITNAVNKSNIEHTREKKNPTKIRPLMNGATGLKIIMSGLVTCVSKNQKASLELCRECESNECKAKEFTG